MTLIESYLTKNPCYKSNVEKADSRYVTFQTRGPVGLMLHSVGCAQPNAMVFVNGWNKESYDKACVHAFIDSNSGAVYQTLPWNFRGWHCGGSGNNTHCGIELCESGYITYINGYQFTVKDREKAQADAKRTYDAAVELFAMLCRLYDLDPITQILSHKEGHAAGIASDHGDPEHYWKGIGMNYTMNGFRNDVKEAMAPEMPFTDVPEGSYYHDAVQWAWENGIVSGTDATHFSPKASVRRCDACVMLQKLYNLLKEGG